MAVLHSWGPPADSLGDDEDFCIDHLSWSLYLKGDGVWFYDVSLRTDTLVSENPQIYTGSGAPAPELGATGSWYIDVDTNILYGPKA